MLSLLPDAFRVRIALFFLIDQRRVTWTVPCCFPVDLLATQQGKAAEFRSTCALLHGSKRRAELQLGLLGLVGLRKPFAKSSVLDSSLFRTYNTFDSALPSSFSSSLTSRAFIQLEFGR